MSGSNDSRGEFVTDGWHVYERLRRGVYHQLDRRGRRMGIVCSGFTPRPRWKEPRVCSFNTVIDGLTCPRCGSYDTGYAETGVRSFCGDQGKGVVA